MPGIDGLEVCRRLRLSGGRAHQPGRGAFMVEESLDRGSIPHSRGVTRSRDCIPRMRHYNEIGERGREPRARPSGRARGRSRPPPVGAAAPLPCLCARPESARADSARANIPEGVRFRGRWACRRTEIRLAQIPLARTSLKASAIAALSLRIFELPLLQGSQVSPRVSQPMRTWADRRVATRSRNARFAFPSTHSSPTSAP